MRKSERKQLKKALREDSLYLFGEIIVELREKEDLSQEDLAYDCGMDRSFMSKIETGKTAPSLLTLMRLAQGLNTKPSVILAMLEEKMLKEKVEIPRGEGWAKRSLAVLVVGGRWKRELRIESLEFRV